MRILSLAIKDLRQLVRDPKMFAFLLAMPIAFTLFFGFLIGGVGKASDVAKPVVAWVDVDGSTVSSRLGQTLDAAGTVRLERMSQAGAEIAVSNGSAAAALVVPAGMGKALASGQPAEVQVLTSAKDPTAAEIALTAVQSAAQAMSSSGQAALASTAALASVKPYADEAAQLNAFAANLQRAEDLARQPRLTVRQSAVQAAVATTPSGFAQSSPGMLVQFTVFNLMSAGIALTQERNSGALRRLLTTPLSKAEIIIGKLLAVFVVLMLQQGILIAVGQLFFHVQYLANPLATLAVCAVFALCLSALGLLVGTLVKTENAAVSATLIIMFVFSALGGAWFPLEITGKTFSAVGHILPSAWAMDAFQSILLRGAGLTGILLPLGVIAAFAVAFAGVAVWRFRWE